MQVGSESRFSRVKSNDMESVIKALRSRQIYPVDKCGDLVYIQLPNVSRRLLHKHRHIQMQELLEH